MPRALTRAASFSCMRSGDVYFCAFFSPLSYMTFPGLHEMLFDSPQTFDVVAKFSSFCLMSLSVIFFAWVLTASSTESGSTLAPRRRGVAVFKHSHIAIEAGCKLFSVPRNRSICPSPFFCALDSSFLAASFPCLRSFGFAHACVTIADLFRFL